MEITRNKVARVYTGRIGCMCGCMGNYSENPATMTRVFNKVNNHPNKKVDADIGCIYIKENGRTAVVYFS